MTRAGPLTDAEYRALARFRYALRVFLRFSEDAARAAGLTPASTSCCWRSGASRTAADDHRRSPSGCSSATTPPSSWSTGPPRPAWSTAHTDADDRRRQRLSLTPRGERPAGALSAAHRDELRRFRNEMADVLRELD